MSQSYISSDVSTLTNIVAAKLFFTRASLADVDPKIIDRTQEKSRHAIDSTWHSTAFSCSTLWDEIHDEFVQAATALIHGNFVALMRVTSPQFTTCASATVTYISLLFVLLHFFMACGPGGHRMRLIRFKTCGGRVTSPNRFPGSHFVIL